MLASTVLSMAIRQIRHLQEVPSDFFRLPMFIIVSTFFLMPVRLLGFLRMAHASGWGTRAGAYAGGDPAPLPDPSAQPGSTPSPHFPDPRPALDDADLMAELAQLEIDRDSAHGPSRVAVRERRTARTTPQHPPAAAPVQAVPGAARRRPRHNPKAAIPYAIAVALLSLEALLYV